MCAKTILKTGNIPLRIPGLAKNRFLFETRPMIKYIKQNLKSDLIGVEIGVQNAKNSYNIINTLNIKRLYLVDPYDFYTDAQSLTYDKINNIKTTAHTRMKNFEYKVDWVETTSDEAVDILPDNLDFVYIDGNHLYKYIKNDIKNYFEKIRVGGVLGGHDIDRSGVIRAFSELVASKHDYLDYYIKSPDWWVVKK